MIRIHELTTDADITAACGVMLELRPHVRADQFLQTVRRQQRDGYRLYGGWEADALAVLAGVRNAETLARGPHLFVDDLVTASTCRGSGYGTAMLRWLAEHVAAPRGLDRLYLDSRDSALGFYRAVGFVRLTSVPCWVEVDRLRSRP